MRTVLRFLFGTVSLLLRGAEPERMLNLCARAGVLFWGVEREDGFTLRMKVTGRGASVVEAMAVQAQCSVERVGYRGLPFFLLRFRKRYALMAGFLLCLLTVSFCSQLIWVMEVNGNERISTTEILSELRRQGVHPGVYGPSIARRELSNEMLLSMEELSFFSLNLHGTKAEILVREKEKKPELLQESVPTDVRACAGGIVTHMEVLAGQALCREGDTVAEGDVLVRGAVQVNKEGEPLEYLWTHAQARITARTWHTLSAQMPLQVQVKDYTGADCVRFALNLPGRRIKFYGNGGISFPKYDKITETKTWAAPDGTILPVSLSKETMRQYTCRTETVNPVEAERLLQEQLLKTLESELYEGTILKTDYVTQQTDDYLTVTLLAECTEQIEEVVPAVEPEQTNPLQTEEQTE